MEVGKGIIKVRRGEVAEKCKWAEKKWAWVCRGELEVGEREWRDGREDGKMGRPRAEVGWGKFEVDVG